MAQLEYEFTSSGLSDLRSEMSDLAEDTREVGDAAETAASDLEDMGDTGAGEAVSGGMEAAERSVSGVGEEAQEAAARLENEFDGAASEALGRIDEMGEALQELNDQQIDVAGGQITSAVGGSAAGAALGSGGAAAIASQLTEAKQPAQALRRRVADVGVEAEEMARAFAKTEKQAQQAAAGAADLGDEAGEAQTKAGQLANQMREIDIPAIGGGGGGGSDDGGGGFIGGLLGGGKLAKLAATSAKVASGIAAVGAAAAVATKQVADFAAAQAEAAQQMKVAEAQSGVAAKKIQELFLVAERLDSSVDLDAIRDAFKEIALRTEEAREGTGEAREAFERLGISMAELEGLSTAEVFEKVRKEASDLTAQQRALTLEQVAGGEAGERLARVFGLQAEEFNRLKDSVGEDAMTSGQIDSLDEMRTQYTRVEQDLRSVKQSIANTFGGPALTVLETFSQTLNDLVRGDNPEIQQPQMVSKPGIQFGSSGEIAEPVQAMNEALSRMETQVAVAREKMSRGLIDKEQMLRQIRRARQQATDELLKLEENHPELIPDSEVSSTVQKLQAVKQKLQALSATDISAPLTGASAAGLQTLPTSIPSPSIEQPGGGLGALQSAAEGADSVEDINSLIGATRDQFDTLANEEAAAFVGKLQAMRAEMKENQAAAKAIGDAMARSVARSADRAFQALGQGVADAIFGGGGGGPGVAQRRLQLFNAKKQVRSLKQSLRKGNVSYRNFQLKMKAQQAKIQKRQEQLNNAMDSGFAKAAKSMLSAFKQMAKQLVAEITAVIAKMAVLKALTAAFNIGSGGFLGSVVSNLGGGAFLDSGASGGTVKQDGLAVIHEGEEIVPSKTVDTLKGLVQPSTPSVQPAMASAGGMNITVNVTGETRTDGRDLKTAYDRTTATQRRKGRR